MIYLDTHVVAWLFAGQSEHLSEQAKALIESEDLVISPMVVLELQYLFEIGRTTETGRLVVTDLAERIGLKVSRASFSDVVVGAEQQTWTRDPFDRIIVGQALVEDALLLTKDATIAVHYPRAVWS